MWRVVSFAVLALALATASVPTGASTGDARVERVDYDLAAPGPFASFETSGLVGDLEVGGTTLAIQPGETTLEVFLLDATTLKVPSRVVFFDGSGAQLGVHEVCFTATLGIPPDATNATVRPSPLVVPCPLDTSHGPATRGDIVATFLR